MRNLKRALSLTLASVMLLGMMVVGSSAKGYDDVKDTDNVEAIEVLQAIEVMVGDERGFGPERPVNRAEMAVVMGKLLSLDYDYYATACPFNDVYDWARGWVGAAYANKILSGRGEGVYDPGSTVTAVEAASMLMRALGYFQYANDTVDGFELSTVRQGTKIGIFDGVGSSATEPMTRNQVAQMVLNALQSGVVEPDGNTINLTTPDGTVLTGKVNYVYVTSNKDFAKAISGIRASSIGSTNDSPIVELGERLYDGKLKLKDDYDPFGRPARNWEYDGKNIGVYAKKELMVFEHVGTVAGKDLYDVLGAKTIEDYKLTVNLDGVKDPAIVRAIAQYDGNTASQTDKHNVDYVFNASDLNRNNKATIGATGTGVLTQVYVNNDTDVRTIDVVIVNTYLARADKDYDTKKEELAVTAYDLAKHTASGEYVKDIKNSTDGTELFKLAAEEFPAVKDAAKNASFLLTVADGKVQSVVPAEVLSGVQVSSFKKGDNVVVDGTTYEFDTTARFDPEALKSYTDLNGNAVINLKDLTYNVYLDAYGNLIGIEEVDAVKNYVFIAAIDLNDSNLVNGTADARAIFVDGTVDTIRVNMGKSSIATYNNTNAAGQGGINKNSILNTWCTYTKNNSDVYTLTEVSKLTPNTTVQPTTNKSGLAQYHETIASGELTIDKKHITLKGKTGATGDFARVYGDEKTVYLTAELSELINDGGTWGVISDVDTVSTGIEATNLVVWNDGVARTEADDNKTKNAAPGYNAGTTGAFDRDWSRGVYTLYDDDGVVIAAVVVGEDNGASKNLVYIHTGDVDSEAYNGNTTARAAGDGLWTWTRKVISNGEEVTLTEVSDGNSYLARMQQYNWYQIKTNGKGEVIKAYKLPNVTDGTTLDDAKLDRYKDLALDYHYYDKNGNKVQDMDPVTGEPVEIGEIAYTVQEGKGTVLYHNEKFINSRLRMSGRTLYVATDDQTGFIVNENVNYVLQQWNSNKKDTFIETGSGAANLESVIKEINDRYGVTASNNVTYTYQISAILENGVASSVVIYDNNNDYVRPGDQKPTGDTSFTSNGVTLVVDSDLKASNFYALITDGTKLTFQFDTDMGAATGSDFTYDYELKSAEGVVIAKNTGVTSDAVAPQFKNEITSAMVKDGKAYTLIISNVKAASYKLTKASSENSLKADDLVLAPASAMPSTGSNALNLTIAANKFVAPEKVTIRFNVTGLDLSDVVLGTGVSGSNGTYDLTVLKSTLASGVDVLKNVKANSAVKFTVVSVTDASSKVAVQYKVDAASQKYVTTFSGTKADLNLTDTNLALSGVTLTPKSVVTAYNYSVKVDGKTAVTLTSGSGATAITTKTVPVENLAVGKPVVVEVHVEPSEFTVDASQIRITGTGTAQDMKFDGDGYVSELDGSTKFVDGAGAGTEIFQVTLENSKPEYVTAASGHLNIPATSKMHVDVSKILDGSDISLSLLQVRSVTIDGADPIYWDIRKPYTVPTGTNGTGASVAVGGGAASYVKYGDTVDAAATPIVITSGYVKVTLNAGGLTASTNYTAIPGLLAGSVKGLAAGNSVTITNGYDTHNIAVAVTETEGGAAVVSGTISCTSAVAADATGATKGTLDVNVGNKDITITLTGTAK